MRFGVTASLFSGLVAMAGFAVVASVLAVQSFRQFQDTLRTFTADSLPTLVAAANIASESQAVTADAPALVAVDSQFAREAIALRIARREQILRDQIEALDRADVAPDAIKRLQKLADDLFKSVNDLSDLIGSRIDTERNRNKARTRVLQLMSDISEAEHSSRPPHEQQARTAAADNTGTSTTGRTTGAGNTPPALSWPALAGEAVGLLLGGLSSSNQLELQRLEQKWKRAIAETERLFNRLSEEDRTAWADARAELLFIGSGDQSVFDIRATQIGLENRVRSAVGRNKVLSDVFAAMATDLRRALQAGLVERSQMFNAQLDRRSDMVMLIGGAGCLGALLILAYIHRRVIRRLRGLQDGMQRSVAGDVVDIPTEGRDEIGDMARALVYFVETIRDREQRFRDYAETSCDCYWESNADGLFTYVSNADFRAVGIEVDAPVVPSQSHAMPENRISNERVHERIRMHRPFSEIEFTTRGLGSLRHFDLSGKPVFDNDGVFTGYRGTATDITVRLNAELDVRDSEKRLIDILESSPIGLSISTRDGRQLFCNRRYLDLHRVEKAQAFEQDSLDFCVNPDDRTHMLDTLDHLGHVDGAEIQCNRADGSRWWAIIYWIPTVFDGQKAYISWHYDITDRKQNEEDLRTAKEAAEIAYRELRETQESLIQAEKMASLGQLVAGVAHEINTPVGIGLTAASHLSHTTMEVRERFGSGRLRKSEFESFISTAEETTRLLMSNLNRASELIQSFKKVSVDQASGDRRKFALDDYLDEIVLSLKPQARRSPCDISMTVDCPQEIFMDSYPGSVSQVITNLVINAIVHAFDEQDEGTIRISAHRNAEARNNGAAEADGTGGTVSIRITDDGSGIPGAHLKKVFDPFFTTKRGSGGSGLGLNIVYNTVRQSLNGRIEVQSAEGRGTTFMIEVPIVLDEATADRPERTEPAPPGSGPAADPTPVVTDQETGQETGADAGEADRVVDSSLMVSVAR